MPMAVWATLRRVCHALLNWMAGERAQQRRFWCLAPAFGGDSTVRARCCPLHPTSALPLAPAGLLPAAAAHGGLCIFHLGSARRVAMVAAHAKNLRALAYDATNNLLLSCSFDKTVKLWEAADAERQPA